MAQRSAFGAMSTKSSLTMVRNNRKAGSPGTSQIGFLSVGQQLSAFLHTGIGAPFCEQRWKLQTRNLQELCLRHQTIHLTPLRRIDPEDIILQTLTRSTRWSGTKCSCNGIVSCKTLVRDLNVIRDSAAKGAEHTQVCLLSMWLPDVVKKEWDSC